MSNLISIKTKIKNISTLLNNIIVRWYVTSGLKNDLCDFRPGFVTDEDYDRFISCFEILKQYMEYSNENVLLYYLVIYYYVLVVFETYVVLDTRICFEGINNESVQKWMYDFSINNSEWASNIKRVFLYFNREKFNTFHIKRFNPYEIRFIKNKTYKYNH
jgi:hypothetical protein